MRERNIAPIGTSEVREKPIDSLRIKVTDRCQWQCAFCHNEGDIATADLTWGPDVQEMFGALKRALPSLQEVHFTGGEPTLDPGLEAVTAGLASLGFDVKTTTNGQFRSDTLNRLIDAGLSSFNFSIHSLDPDRFLRFQLGRGLWWLQKEKKTKGNLPGSDLKRARIEKRAWAEQQIKNQQRMILEAKERGVDVKVNTVISSMDDVENAQEVFEWAKTNGIPLRLLNDLGNGLESVNAIRSFIEQTGAREVLRQVTIGVSACSTVYRTPDGYEFAFKQIRDQKLESMCRSCPRAEDGSCEEQFYGIRLQKGRDGKYYVLLCIQESNPQTQMTLEEFLESDQLKDIQSYLHA